MWWGSAPTASGHLGTRALWGSVSHHSRASRSRRMRAGESTNIRASSPTSPEDGRADITGFGDDGVWISLGNGDGSFQPATFVLQELGFNQGWRVDSHPPSELPLSPARTNRIRACGHGRWWGWRWPRDAPNHSCNVSIAANCTPCTCAPDAEKACVSSPHPPRKGCSNHDNQRTEQCDNASNEDVSDQRPDLQPVTMPYWR
jgi:hypothetical protein